MCNIFTYIYTHTYILIRLKEIIEKNTLDVMEDGGGRSEKSPLYGALCQDCVRGATGLSVAFTCTRCFTGVEDKISVFLARLNSEIACLASLYAKVKIRSESEKLVSSVSPPSQIYCTSRN